MQKHSVNSGRLKISAYWKFILMYIIILSISFSALIPLYNTMMDISKRSFLDDAQSNIEQSNQTLSGIVDSIYQTPTALQYSSSYRYMLILRSVMLPRTHYAYLSTVQSQFSSQYVQLQETDERFIYFSGCKAGATRSRVFPSMKSCFESYIKYADINAASVIESLTIDEQITILPATMVSINGQAPKSYMTIITRQLGSSVIVGALLNQQTLLDIYNFADMPEGSFLYITNSLGNYLFSYGYDGEPIVSAGSPVKADYSGGSYTVLSSGISSLESTVSIGIPDEYFVSLLSPLRKLNIRYIIIMLALGIALSIGFASYNYMPIRKLLRLSSADDAEDSRRRNEYSYIGEMINSTNSKNQRLQERILSTEKTLRTNLFVRLVYGNLLPTDGRTETFELLPQLAEPCRMALLSLKYHKDDSVAADHVSFYVSEEISSLAESNFIAAQLDRRQFAIMFPDKEKELEILTKAIDSINGNPEIREAASVCVGISSSFTGADHVHAAMCQARNCLTLMYEAPVCFYRELPDKEAQSGVGWIDFQRLYQILVSGDTESAKDMLGKMCHVISKSQNLSEDSIKQTFYTLQYIIKSSASELQLSPESVQIPKYREHDVTAELIFDLKNSIESIGNLLDERRVKESETMKQSFMEYINSNYSDKDIYAQSIAEKFGISERYVYILARSCTGKSLNSYIEELRIQKAADLLMSTDLPIDNIIVACGFNARNTFYRVFKNHFGVSSSQYRKGSENN